jgi:hypothetical protein
VSSILHESWDAGRTPGLQAAERLLLEPPPLELLSPAFVRVHCTSVVHPSSSRPVVRWDLSVGQGTTERSLVVIGRGFDRGGGERDRDLLLALRASAHHSQPVGVPEPYGWDPRRRLLAQSLAPVDTLHDLLVSEPLGALSEISRAGRWLARLHAVGGIRLGRVPQTVEQHRLEQHGAALAKALPRLARRIRPLVRRTSEDLARVDLPLVVTHGDFRPRTVHLDPDRVVVTDFGRAAMAPAARDLGCFLGHALALASDIHADPITTGLWGSRLVRSYVEAGGSRFAVRQSCAFVARTFAEVLHRRFVARPAPAQGSSQGSADEWVDRWESALDGELLR